MVFRQEGKTLLLIHSGDKSGEGSLKKMAEEYRSPDWKFASINTKELNEGYLDTIKGFLDIKADKGSVLTAIKVGD